jgi:hypothetical protein
MESRKTLHESGFGDDADALDEHDRLPSGYDDDDYLNHYDDDDRQNFDGDGDVHDAREEVLLWARSLLRVAFLVLDKHTDLVAFLDHKAFPCPFASPPDPFGMDLPYDLQPDCVVHIVHAPFSHSFHLPLVSIRPVFHLLA